MGQNLQFWSFWGYFCPFDPPGLKNQIFPRVKSTQYVCISTLLNFWRVSEKFNGWIKSYGAKIAIFVILGVFLTPLTTRAQKLDFFHGQEYSIYVCISFV